MAKLNWDKVRQDNLMKKHGVETVPKTYPKIYGTLTYGEKGKVNSADVANNIQSFKLVSKRKRSLKQKRTNNDLIQCTQCHARVSRNNKIKHINKVHGGVNISKRPTAIPVKPNTDLTKTISIKVLAKELQPAVHQFIMNCAHKAGIKIKSPEQYIPEKIAKKIRLFFSPTWK